jgi:hypothetical protein
MQNSSRKWQLVFTALAVVIAGVMCLVFARSRNAAEEQVVAPPAPFGSNNYNVMKTDTFVALVNQAYSGLVTQKTEDGILELQLRNANELTKDFFNGNDALLRFKLNDHGFELNYNPEAQSLTARFKINERNGVNVPNDVLIKLMDKTTKVNHVDNQE